MLSRDEIVLRYMETLLYAPYPVQEEALYAWASCEQGILLSAPTGTGKTLVAEAAVYEGLQTGKQVYYSTPLIALTDQKLLELQQTVTRWGFKPQDVGLITGNRSVNPDAQVKVVVAEVLLNRLLHRESHDFSNVGAVVMDEFHNFAEPQRGIVWELSLSLLPLSVRVMLLSATVGAANEFVNWMARSLNRTVTLVEGKERKIPLHYEWVGDELLPDYLERIAGGTEQSRRTPALVFCFDREICWSTAEILKGKDLFAEGQRKSLLDRLETVDFSIGSGNRLRTFLARGVGIHHAGLLPRYRRVVETLFQEKLLPYCVCTETLAAGLNLPARSVILSTLVKGPKDKKKLIDPAAAQQMFGRAGRPQFDTEGHVIALAHEDDVQLARWKEKYDSIPEETKDPGLLMARKKLAKKKPTRRAGVTYWNAEQFVKLQTAPPQRLVSRGNLNWRWLAYLLSTSPSLEPIRQVIRTRLMDQPTIEAELKRLSKMIVTLHQMGIVIADPPPSPTWQQAGKTVGADLIATPVEDEDESDEEAEKGEGGDRAERVASTLASASKSTPHPNPLPRSTEGEGTRLGDLIGKLTLGGGAVSAATRPRVSKAVPAVLEPYEPLTATPTARLKDLMVFRAVHPLYGLFLMDYLAQCDDNELLQILDSLLVLPGSVAKSLRVPWPDVLPPGKFTLEVVDPQLLSSGVVSHEDLYPPPLDDQRDLPPELRKYPIPLADKMRMLFENTVDHAGGLFVSSVWAAGDLIQRGGNFDQFVRTRDLLKQEGILFKHMLRMILLCQEFAQLTPLNGDQEAWEQRLSNFINILADSCRAVDPQSTDALLQEMSEEG